MGAILTKRYGSKTEGRTDDLYEALFMSAPEPKRANPAPLIIFGIFTILGALAWLIV